MKKSIKIMLTLMTCFCTLSAMVGCNPVTVDPITPSDDPVSPSPSPETTTKNPNIVIVLVDDMGFSDLGCYGSEIKTPNIDSLAAHGVRFSQFYNTARCCPSRASLLTGLSPHQAGVGHMVSDTGREDAYAGTLNEECVTIAEVLKTAGYNTYMSGKWHVSKNTSTSGDTSSWPLQRGFDKYYGILQGSTSYWNPETLMYGNDPISSSEYLTKYPSDNVPDTYYLTDAISDASVTFIEDHQDNDNPYFMYVAYTAPHWPLEAPQENIDHYEGVYDAGWDEIRQARYEKQLELGIIDESTQLTDRPSNVSSWDSYTGDKDLQALTMSKYAACIERMDEGVGKILDAIDASGEADNTVIMFLSDNGGCAELGTYATDVNPSNYRHPAIGEAWANVANTPFIKYKHYMSEGGIAAPFIVKWPDQITDDRRGIIETTPGSIVDIMATCVDIADAEYPDYAHGNVIPSMEGTSLASVFTGEESLDDRYICAEHEGRSMVRTNKWKLVREPSSGATLYTTAWKLFDMENDRSETTDLASQYPDLVDELATAWNMWAIRCDVFPMYYGDTAAGYYCGYAPSLDGKTYYSIMNMSNSESLQYNTSVSDNATVTTVSNIVGLSVQWAFVDAGNGYIKIVNRINNMCLQDTAQLNTNSSDAYLVNMVSSANSDDCLWQKVDASSSYYKLQNKQTGRVLAYCEDAYGNEYVGTISDCSDNIVYWEEAAYNNATLNELVYYVEKAKTVREEMYHTECVTLMNEAANEAYTLMLEGASSSDILQAYNTLKNAYDSLVCIYDEIVVKETKSYVLPNGYDFFNASDWTSADSSGTARTTDEIIDDDGSLIFTENTASRFELFHVVQDSSTGAWRHPGTPSGNLTNATSIYGTTYTYNFTINASGQFDILVLGGANCYSMDNANGPGIFFRFTTDGKVTIYAAKSSAAGSQYMSWGEFSGSTGFNFYEDNVVTFNITRVDADTLTIGLEINGQAVNIEGQDSDIFSANQGVFTAVGYTISSNTLGQRCGFYADSGQSVKVSDLELKGLTW